MSLALALILGAVLDAMTGEPKVLWSRVSHPVIVIGNVISTFETRFNNGPFRRLKGVFVTLTLLGLAMGLGWAIGHVTGPLSWVFEVLIVAVFLAQKSLVDHVRAVAGALAISTQAGRDAVGMIVGRDTRDLDDAAISRAAIESAAENFSDGIIAPAFWFLVGGLPGLLAYKVINTADSMIGYRNERYEQFGWAAARLDDVMNLIPARLSALLILAVAVPLRAVPLRAAWGIVWRDAPLHRSPNAGWPEAAMACGLGVALSGPRSYDGTMRDLPWVNGDGRRSTTRDDIARACVVLWRAWGLGLTLVGVIGMLAIVAG